MGYTSGDRTAKYFKKGAEVEISSNEEGFRRSLYTGIVIRPPGNTKKTSSKVLVEYKTLMQDEQGKKPIREELELVQLRPPPPRESHRSFKFSDEVDAYYNDGWWEGIVTEVVGDDKYLVFFRGSREQLPFKASQLRLHREWVYGKWVPPLEASPKITCRNEESPSSARAKSRKRKIGYHFGVGELIEVCSNEEGFEGALFTAKIVKMSRKDKYLVEYQSLRNDKDTGFLKEEVDNHHVRPCPPEVSMVDSFEVGDGVDAFYNDCWWSGIISKVHKNDTYSVYFETSKEELDFNQSNMRVHQEWRDGKWMIPSKVLATL